MTPLRLLMLVTFAVFLGIHGGASATAVSSCADPFSVAPGVGRVIVTKVLVRGVSCRSAHRAITQFERINPANRTHRIIIAGRGFRCTRTHVGAEDSGLSIVRCRHGAARTVRWSADYGI